MIRQLTDLPDGVLGFEADGEIHADDYKDTIIPAIEGVIADGHDVRVVLVFPEFAGYSAGAAWQDLKMGMDHLHKWKRVALVTDVDWMVHLVNLFGWMSPGDVKHFPLAERAAAITWAATSGVDDEA
jgi:hypothetical protein